MKYMSLPDLDSSPKIEYPIDMGASDINPLPPDVPVMPVEAVAPTQEDLDDIGEAPRKRAEKIMELVLEGVSVTEAKQRAQVTLDPTTERELRKLLAGFYVGPEVQKALVRATRVKTLAGAMTMFDDPDLEEREKINAGKLMLAASDAMAGDPEVGLKLPDTVVNVDLRTVKDLAEKMGEYGYKEEDGEGQSG